MRHVCVSQWSSWRLCWLLLLVFVAVVCFVRRPYLLRLSSKTFPAEL